MEKKYVVVVYRNDYRYNNYYVFIHEIKAKQHYKHMLNELKNQTNDLKKEPKYIVKVKLFTLTEVCSSI